MTLPDNEPKPNDEPKWRRQPDERPQQITRAALAVFSLKGYRAATMQEIAEQAGISKGAIYLYFESKMDLFVATIRAQFQAVLDLFSEIRFDQGQSAEELTRRVGVQSLRVLMSPEVTQALPLVIGEYPHMPELKQIYFEEILSRSDLQAARLIEMGQAMGLLRPMNPTIAARCLLGVFFMFALTQEVFGAKEFSPMDPEEIVDTIVDIYARGMLTAEAQA